jgi:DNA-binding NarL/FixJ family response regulator
LIVISGNELIALQKSALEKGANAFISKSATPHEIAATVHKAMTGQWLMPKFDLNVEQSEHAKPFLTLRQSEVLQLLAMGLSNKRIAKQMDLAEVTVKLHVSGIFRAFGVNCRSKALMIARKSGLLSSH